MAQVLDSLATTRTRQVFTKMPDIPREYTPVPRAIVQFHIDSGVVAAKPVNDTYEITISVVLELRAAYRFLDFNWSLITDTAKDFTPIGYMEIINGIRGAPIGQTNRHAFTLGDSTLRDNSLDEVWIAKFVSELDRPRYIVQSVRQGIAPTIAFNAVNLTAAASLAGTTDFFCSFFEYDIEQAEHFPLHFPVQTIAR